MSVEGIAQRALRLQGELERIRSLLAKQPTVQQAIVFGSTATSQARLPSVRAYRWRTQLADWDRSEGPDVTNEWYWALCYQSGALPAHGIA